MTNSILKALKERRSNFRFKSTPIDDEKLDLILEAGRWAPSWTNTQPWRFIVIKDKLMQKTVSNVVPTVFSLAVQDAPISIAICVNTKKDPYHFIEDVKTVEKYNPSISYHICSNIIKI